jgi:hypothetical protein
MSSWLIRRVPKILKHTITNWSHNLKINMKNQKFCEIESMKGWEWNCQNDSWSFKQQFKRSNQVQLRRLQTMFQISF